jgi:hypothetical protein
MIVTITNPTHGFYTHHVFYMDEKWMFFEGCRGMGWVIHYQEHGVTMSIISDRKEGIPHPPRVVFLREGR